MSESLMALSLPLLTESASITLSKWVKNACMGPRQHDLSVYSCLDDVAETFP